MTESDEHQVALETALESVTLSDEFAATIQLARWYAYVLDVNPATPDLAKTVGPIYLSTLAALGMTKNATTAKAPEGGGQRVGSSALEQLRERARQRNASDQYPAAG